MDLLCFCFPIQYKYKMHLLKKQMEKLSKMSLWLKQIKSVNGVYDNLFSPWIK